MQMGQREQNNKKFGFVFGYMNHFLSLVFESTPSSFPLIIRGIQFPALFELSVFEVPSTQVSYLSVAVALFL